MGEQTLQRLHVVALGREMHWCVPIGVLCTVCLSPIREGAEIYQHIKMGQIDKLTDRLAI